jgi:hypothetical protein
MLALQGYYRINKSNHEAKHSKLELKRRIASKQAKENQNNYEIFVLTGSNLNTSCSNEGQEGPFLLRAVPSERLGQV